MWTSDEPDTFEDDLAERTGADELLASTSTYDRAALLASDAMLRELVA